ncbi:lasso peptide biosynthesis PqqD family chaperone [Streptomyces sp. NPDC002039]|uniref:lasso peptide biosynthesis PqqD family chaperone n=1 Tax=Streptomyces sp. NPDC002039 TaxID=3154660 RepID=UPI00332C21DC
MLLQQRTGRYWQLNRTGAGVLTRLLAGEHAGNVASELAARHGLSRERVHNDITTLIDQLRAARLVEAP